MEAGYLETSEQISPVGYFRYFMTISRGFERAYFREILLWSGHNPLLGWQHRDLLMPGNDNLQLAADRKSGGAACSLPEAAAAPLATVGDLAAVIGPALAARVTAKTAMNAGELLSSYTVSAQQHCMIISMHEIQLTHVTGVPGR